jgi:hypothetical protein
MFMSRLEEMVQLDRPDSGEPRKADIVHHRTISARDDLSNRSQRPGRRVPAELARKSSGLARAIGMVRVQPRPPIRDGRPMPLDAPVISTRRGDMGASFEVALPLHQRSDEAIPYTMIVMSICHLCMPEDR